MKDLNKIQEFFSKPLEENQTESKYKKGDKITYYGNKGVVNSAKWNSMAKDWEYYVTYYKDDVRRSDNGINDRELKPLEENMAKAFDLQKGLNGMNYDVKVKHLNDFGKDVYEIYSQKSLDSDKIFFDAKKLGFPNVRVFDNMNEVKVGDKVKINKEYGGGKGTIEDIVGSFVVVNGKSYHESDVEKVDLDEEKGYSPQLVTPENPKGETKGLTPDVMNKILMKVIQDLDESRNKINKA